MRSRSGSSTGSPSRLPAIRTPRSPCGCDLVDAAPTRRPSDGHPDKMADQISDSVLDAALTEDPYSRVACETLVTTGLCVVAGEISTKAQIDISRLARDAICSIG